MGSFDLITILFFVAAVIVFVQLRSVLGRRTGNERPPFDPYAGRRQPADGRDGETGTVITLPRREEPGAAAAALEAADAYAKPGSEVNTGLRAIIAADPQFNPNKFLDGARMAYEMIVTAFADGDRKALKGLLSKEVYDGFVASINEREAKGETVKSSFVGVDRAIITAAEMKGTDASVTVRITSQLISATYDRGGAVVDGDAEEVAEVKDVWTFARDTRSRDPNWKLIATESES